MKIVGIGASAGGMEALIAFLKYLPKDTGAAFVLIQHLSPDHRSIMDEILSKYTQMPVVAVDKNTTPSPNCIYLNVPQKNILFKYGMLITEDRNLSKVLNLPIDNFFHSLGDALQKEAIALIFSGSGTDGSRGCRTIKANGGLVFVQDLKSAAFDGMPRSVIDLEIADMIGSPKEMAEMLAEVLKKRISLNEEDLIVNLTKEPDKNWFLRILDYVSSVVSVNFRDYREPTLVRRMDNRMLLQRIEDLEEYYHFLLENEGEVRALCKDFLIGVTSFFRDADAFKELGEHIIPEMVATAIEENQLLRVWIPACSTGEEAYSIAILLDNYLRKNKIDIDYKVFGSDINPQAIRKASKGIYPYNLLADAPDHVILNYFEKVRHNYQIKQRVREKMLFAVHNVLADPPFIRMNLISCRNFLIYLKPDTQRKLLTTFHFALNPHAYLFLGPSESLGEFKNVFNRTLRKWNVFQKKDTTQLIPSRKSKPIRQDSEAYPLPNQVEKNTLDLPQLLEVEEELDPFTTYLTGQFAPLCLFINEDLNVLFANIDVERRLGESLKTGNGNLDSLLNEEELNIFKKGFQEVLDNRKIYSYPDFVLANLLGRESKGDLLFKLVELGNSQEKIVLVEVKLQDNQQDQPLFEELRKQRLFDEQLQRMEKELVAFELKTEKLVREQENINEELKTSNRELIASNEELQSTNEELQSVNEELYTVNNELQIRNEQLTTANDDLNNILKSTEIGIVFLDDELRIRKFTQAVQNHMSIVENDIGRIITNFSHNFNDLDMGEICRKVYQTLTIYEQEVKDEHQNYFLVRVLPYRTEEDMIHGLVVYFLNITELVKVRKVIKGLARKYEALFQFSEDVIIEVQDNGKVDQVNKNLASISRNVLEGQSIFKFLSADNSKRLQSAFAKTMEVEAPQTLNKFNIDGSSYDICVLPLKNGRMNKQKTSPKLLLLATDRTEQQKTLSQLENSIAKYTSFIDNLPFQVLLVEKSGRIVYVNFIVHSTKTKKEYINTNITDYLSPEDSKRYLQSLEDIFAGKPFREISFSYISSRDGQKVFHLIATPVIIDKHIQLAAVISRETFRTNK